MSNKYWYVMRDLDHKIYCEGTGWAETPVSHGQSRLSEAMRYSKSLVIRGQIRPNAYSLVRLEMETNQ